MSVEEYRQKHQDAKVRVVSPSLTARDLEKEIARLYKELDRRPTTEDMRKHGKYSLRPYYERYGSWPEALHATGIKTP
jgi:hypothetical protein